MQHSNAQTISNTAITLLFSCAFCCIPWLSFGQKSSTETKEPPSKVELVARPLKDSIMLRWAANNSSLWEEANKKGYTIERVTILRDGKLLPAPEHKILTPSPRVPLPLSQWESAVKHNKYAAIAAQALYGVTFDVKNKTSTDIYSVVTRVRERDSRFSFALFAADQSSEVAKLSGLWYTDKAVNPNEKYLYRVFITGTKADTGIVYTGTDEFQPLPKPLDLKAEFGDRIVNLNWNHMYFERIYTAYILERSDNGKTFRPLTDEPIVNLIPSGQPDPKTFFKTDSMPENNKKYYYRVKGINAFGEISEPSEVVSGEGHKSITFTPYITENHTIDNQKVYLQWEFPQEKNIEIIGFKMARSMNPKLDFRYIAENIPVEKREFIDPRPTYNNYYIISAYNKYGEEVRSFPVLVQLVDSVPPAQPIDLTGKIDTAGIVKLCWKANKDEDIYGYRIYRANYGSEEYTQLTISPIPDTCFTDTINLNTLTKTVFYKIMSVDLRQNHSIFSKPLELKRPDVVPPVSPVFVSSISAPEGVNLEWVNSTSSDVKDHMLYRSIPHSKDWKLIAVFNVKDSVTHYLDKEADSTTYCAYTLIAKDESNLESKPADPVKGKKIDTKIRPAIDKVFVNINREKGNIQISWKKPAGNVYRFQIYRAEGEHPMTLYTSIAGDIVTFTDEKVQPNSVYQYSIKIVFTDGSQSTFSAKTIVQY
jgi:uncharacterized protein